MTGGEKERVREGEKNRERRCAWKMKTEEESNQIEMIGFDVKMLGVKRERERERESVYVCMRGCVSVRKMQEEVEKNENISRRYIIV